MPTVRVNAITLAVGMYCVLKVALTVFSAQAEMPVHSKWSDMRGCCRTPLIKASEN